MPAMALFITACAWLPADGAQATTVVLENALWSVRLDPSTLAIAVTPAGEPNVVVSSGSPARPVSGLHGTPTLARWYWNDGAYELGARLIGPDLHLWIAPNQPGTLTLLRQPPDAWGRGLILPLAEGAHIPPHDRVWRDFLLRSKATLDTSQDLSLPMWGLDHTRFSLSWILTNPFNNHIRFVPQGEGLALTLEHTFTPLDVETSMTLLLHLGDGDLLAGAKRYREWLMSTARGLESLRRKISVAPGTAILLGAPHVYLWGSGLIAPRDVRNWPRLLAALKGGSALAGQLRQQFDTESLRLLQTSTGTPGAYEREALVRAFNEAMNALARKGWQSPKPDFHAIARPYTRLRAQAAKVFGRALAPNPARWGGGVSTATIQALRDAGLQELWLGIGEGWEGGLWHPEAIRAGVNAGFLVAPYDSYETVLKPGERPAWTTAHLGAAAYHRCAIGRPDGSLQPGFQQSGHYAQPGCMRPLMKARISALRAAAPFNSWFLDAYATGMVFDSYAPAQPIVQPHYADEIEANIKWVSRGLQLPVGSEDGNATTSEGLMFAHGMQTPVIGWGDPALQTDPASPYFLGRWYPEDEPALFFKRVPLKAPYHAVHVDARTRLPLYQTVFHDSVITSHHWLFDNLKLANASAERELTQLLYNVPPLYHLSADTLAQRLPLIVRQNAFFGPLHRRLATQALTGFRWLSADRRVQQTTFADGTTLTANFGATDYRVECGENNADPCQNDNGDDSIAVVPAGTIVARLPGHGAPLRYRPVAD